MSHYDLKPELEITTQETGWNGYENIAQALKKQISGRTVIAIECYPGVNNDEIATQLVPLLDPELTIQADDATLPVSEINALIKRTLTDDRVFGVMSHYELAEFFDPDKVAHYNEQIKAATRTIVVYGTGATLLAEADTLIYADITRWEIQCRFRNENMSNWKADNHNDDALRKFKRGYFFEWRIADRLKNRLHNSVDFLLDTNIKNTPKMISGAAYRAGLKQFTEQPFRLVPYFDSSVWGGQWMKEQFNLDPNVQNYGWAFDGVPEENSIILSFANVKIEVPATNIVHQFPDELLGPKVHSRFGREFPIRFDYLDTVGGGNLSLQVHPLVEYAQDKFGIHYTQEESYYILQASEKSTIYLGVKEDTTKEALIQDLRRAENSDFNFPDEKHINVFPVKKHDHFLIPPGTIHCGGPDTVVLEISATPYIFTFKLWDWGRKGLDGLPRPVHIDHGEPNLLMDRSTSWVKENLINQFKTLHKDEKVHSESTGLHELEFIQTDRHWFSDYVDLDTHDSVNMLNLVEGEQIQVESLNDAFAPFTVHYGETFIVPEQVKRYRIRVTSTTNAKHAIIQAYVRN
ncbi:class I mannose-6-phosphate isomerase [Listeria booriae]|uniref:class I mannose-6-phosphate isomerase n=1 Tax=Listeria booriae TaxID=1552123 RepID=UPI001629FE0A|nr:class I mannose-6-phosphate isomerase [Listeria booriae]MBC2173634.1 mannose-6-phosphate isomerase [Listeria booriae]